MGGGTKVMIIHANALAGMGHAVRIVSPPPARPTLRQRVRSLLHFQKTSTYVHGRSYMTANGVEHLVLDRHRAVGDADVPPGDVTIATWWETAEWVSKMRAGTGAKVYFIQGHEVFPYLPVERCRASYRLPMHKIVVAAWLRELMRAEYGDDSVDVVPNAVDHQQFFAVPRGKQPVPTVGFVYSTSDVKGLDLVLAAIVRLRSKYPSLRIVSFGSERPRGVFGLPRSTQFWFCPQQDVIRDIYAQCDVWISGSRSEGFNLPVMEAMACRTPVVATRTGWPQEAIENGRNGILVNVDDVGAIVGGVDWLLSLDDAAWRGVSENAFTTVSQKSWRASTQQFEAALLRACQRAQRGEIAGNCASSSV